MARKRTDSSESTPPLRLRIPASLAIAVMGGATTIAMSFAACDPTPDPEPPNPDAGEISSARDAGPDTVLADGEDPLVDAGALDGATDAPADAAPPIDAPPDTPVG